jgi:hypothetical protein
VCAYSIPPVFGIPAAFGQMMHQKYRELLPPPRENHHEKNVLFSQFTVVKNIHFCSLYRLKELFTLKLLMISGMNKRKKTFFSVFFGLIIICPAIL